MVAVSDAQQRSARCGLPPDLSLLRKTPAAQERGTPVQQDDLRPVENLPFFILLVLRALYLSASQ